MSAGAGEVTLVWLGCAAWCQSRVPKQKAGEWPWEVTVFIGIEEGKMSLLTLIVPFGFWWFWEKEMLGDVLWLENPVCFKLASLWGEGRAEGTGGQDRFQDFTVWKAEGCWTCSSLPPVLVLVGMCSTHWGTLGIFHSWVPSKPPSGPRLVQEAALNTQLFHPIQLHGEASREPLQGAQHPAPGTAAPVHLFTMPSKGWALHAGSVCCSGVRRSGQALRGFREEAAQSTQPYPSAWHWESGALHFT